MRGVVCLGSAIGFHVAFGENHIAENVFIGILGEYIAYGGMCLFPLAHQFESSLCKWGVCGFIHKNFHHGFYRLFCALSTNTHLFERLIYTLLPLIYGRKQYDGYAVFHALRRYERGGGECRDIGCGIQNVHILFTGDKYARTVLFYPSRAPRAAGEYHLHPVRIGGKFTRRLHRSARTISAARYQNHGFFACYPQLFERLFP